MLPPSLRRRRRRGHAPVVVGHSFPTRFFLRFGFSAMESHKSVVNLSSQITKIYVSDEDRAALVEKFLPLVKSVVDRMKIFLPSTLDIEDLYSVGATGLMAAVRKYDMSQSAAFPAFASIHIRGAVRDELRRMDWTPRSVREKAKLVREALEGLEQRLGRPALESEVASEMGLPLESYWDLLDQIRPVSFVPLDNAFSGEEGGENPLHEKVSDESQENARESLEKREVLNLVAEQIKKMPDLPKKILAMYYFENMRLAEIALVFRLSEGRISQIHTQAVLSLRNFLKRINNLNICS
jgi:RNA polymerase sigma factor for flagellar operon FliA